MDSLKKIAMLFILSILITACVGADDESDTNKDTTPPVITLNGASTVNLVLGEAYVDLGATSNDASGSPVMIDTSAVNNNIVGTYTVTFNATDNAGNNAIQVIRTVVVVRTDSIAPVFTSSATVNVAENNTLTGYTATATDTNSIVYSLTGGADAAKFSINTTTGVLSFQSAPDFENPTDADSSNTYLVEISATDSQNNIAALLITITVTDVVESSPPVITLNGAITVNLVLGEAYVDLGANSSDASGSPVMIDTSAVNKNVVGAYTVTFNATGSTGNNAIQVIRTVVVIRTDSIAPVFTSSATANAAENSTSTGYTAAATDTNSITYSLTGGADAAKFSINPTTGVLSFQSAPDFENPTDADSNNTYLVEISATDSQNNIAAFLVTIAVTDVLDTLPVITLNGAITVNLVLGEAYVDLGATFNDAGGSPVMIDTSAVNKNAVGAYTVTFNATGSTGSNAIQVIRTVVVIRTDLFAPVFTSSATANVAENNTSTGYTAVATDTNSITYSLTGGADAATFSINPSTGVLNFQSAPDFENPTDADSNNTYLVEISATDSQINITPILITVTITDESDSNNWGALNWDSGNWQ